MNSKRLLSRRFLAVPIGVWLIILVSRCALLGVMKVGRAVLPPPPYEGSWMLEKDHPFRDYLANFDGAWFIRVAALGYKRLETGDYDLEAEKKRLRVMDEWGYEDGRKSFGYRQFPLFPYLIRAVQKVIGDWTFAGLAVSNFFSFIFLLYLFRLTELELNERAAWWSVAFATLAPNGHYLLVLYSEGLVLASMVGSTYHARRGQWGRSMLWALVGSATRLEPTFLVFVLFFIHLEQSGGWKASFKSPRLLFAIGGPLGLLFPVFEYWRMAGSPLAPYRSMRDALGGTINWPWYSLIQDFRNPNLLTMGVDLPVLFISLILTVLVAKRLSRPLAALAVMGMLARLAHPHMALLRFTMANFPYYIYMGYLGDHRPRVAIILLIISTLLLFLFSALFVSGYWVA